MTPYTGVPRSGRILCQLSCPLTICRNATSQRHPRRIILHCGKYLSIGHFLLRIALFPAKAPCFGRLSPPKRNNDRMLIIAIAWLYVVSLMALTETSFVAGLATFVFYGVLPLSVVLYLVATPRRRKIQRARDAGKDRNDSRS